MALYISVASPAQDLDQSEVNKAITALAAKAFQFKQGGNFPNGPDLDITFMLSTDEDKPEFQGLRMGGFTHENQTLFFEVAVPLEMTHSQLASDYVSAILADVVDNSDSYFEEINYLSFNKQQWQDVIKAIVGNSSQGMPQH